MCVGGRGEAGRAPVPLLPYLLRPKAGWGPSAVEPGALPAAGRERGRPWRRAGLAEERGVRSPFRLDGIYPRSSGFRFPSLSMRGGVIEPRERF